MTSKIENISVLKWILINIGLIVFGYLLFSGAYGAVAGIYLAGPTAIGGNLHYKDYLNKDQLIAYQKGELNFKEVEVPPDVISKIMPSLKKQAKKVNWLIVFPIMNLLVFGVLGAIAGLFKLNKYVGIIPAIMLFTTIPVMDSEIFIMVNRHSIAVFVSIMAQFVGIYAFAYFTKQLRIRRKKSSRPNSDRNSSQINSV